MDRRQGLVLVLLQRPDARKSEIQQPVQLVSGERSLLASALHLHQLSTPGRDDVEIDRGRGILDVLEVEHRLVLDDRAAGVTAIAFVPVWVCEAIIPVAFGVIAIRYLLFAIKHMKLSVSAEDEL